MIKSFLNARTVLAVIGLAIVLGSLFYVNYLSAKIAETEKQKVETWVEAQRTLLNTTTGGDLDLAIKISTENNDIPIIETDEHNKPTGNFKNIDVTKVEKDTTYLVRKVNEFKQEHEPFILEISEEPRIVNKYFYGNSILQNELRFFPIIQLLVIALFIALLVASQRQANKSVQNRLWIGMAKETAHQLGTPLTSLTGWVELLKANDNTVATGNEIEKDVDRLKLISDRFGKIGSQPPLEEHNIVKAVSQVVTYIQRIAGGRISFDIKTMSENIPAHISPPLFEWVIENLLKNALDAIDQKGKVSVDIFEKDNKVIIDISDTGKGIAYTNQKKVFEPGFTTKKRGWGLGLALTKRIVEEYHNGKIFVKQSEPGSGTTFRIEIYKN